jgi:Alcohol dehydrogenase GroES-like domain
MAKGVDHEGNTDPVIRWFGGSPDHDFVRPRSRPDEVLVRIKASAVNPLDGIVRMGHFPIAKEPPLILGEEAAGIVDRNGAGFKAGERVIVYGGGLGVFRDGTWAEAVAVPGSCLRRMPEGMSFEEAAALANVGVTAYGALRTAALKPARRWSSSERPVGWALPASRSGRQSGLASLPSCPRRGRQRTSSLSGRITWWRCLAARWPSKCEG